MNDFLFWCRLSCITRAHSGRKWLHLASTSEEPHDRSTASEKLAWYPCKPPSTVEMFGEKVSTDIFW